jgi:hypothetical protein
MDITRAFSQYLDELGVYLQSEKALAVAALGDLEPTIEALYLQLWHLSNSLRELVRVAATPSGAAPTVEEITNTIIRFVESFKAAEADPRAIDYPRVVHAPDGIIFWRIHLPSYADVLRELAKFGIDGLQIAHDPQRYVNANNESNCHPQGKLLYEFSPIEIAKHWDKSRGILLRRLSKDWWENAEPVGEDAPVETADSSDAYIIASQLGWQEKLATTSYKKFTAFLIAHPEIRHEPRGQRRYVHAADFARCVAALESERANALELAPEAVEAAIARKETIDARKGRK